MWNPTPTIGDLGIDPAAVRKLLPHLDSFVKWDLLRFLHEAPDIPTRVEDLARYLGRDETELKPAASALAVAGILKQEEKGGSYRYSLVEDEEIRELLGHLVERYQEDRLVRLAISAGILKAQRNANRLIYAAR
ncbi:MAG TPA: hypothetical protein VHS06_06975 [Chloroflexota bacterium]|nr:hypothetical protein [Chloroflexota bacterium]HEX2987897.1 hypothetical protein [Chloroflexota bacterium]